MFGTIEIRWRRLRLPLAVCAAAVLAGGAVATAAWRHEHRTADRMDAAGARLAEARDRYSALAEDRRTRRRYGPPYRRLAAEGRLGGEQPARWAEAVRSAAATVLAARPRIGASRAARRDGPIEVRATDMSIDLEMLHEADLPVFLAALDREAPGLFTVAGCRLLRTDETSPSLATVGASCRIRWQSVVLSGAAPGWMPAAAGSDDGEEAGPEPAIGPAAGPAAGRGVGAGGWGPALADPPRETFGRIFTTVAQRAEIESALAARLAAGEAPEDPVETSAAVPEAVPEETPAREPEPSPRTTRWVRVGGLVARSGRPVYAWVDERRVALDGAQTEAEADAHGVRLHAGRRSIVVRPGQRFDPRTGAVTDPIHRPMARFERDRFLHDSSRAPLTDLPPLEQN